MTSHVVMGYFLNYDGRFLYFFSLLLLETNNRVGSDSFGMKSGNTEVQWMLTFFLHDVYSFSLITDTFYFFFWRALFILS